MASRTALIGTRILLADDHALVRGGVRLLLESAGAVVVAEASNGEELVALAPAIPADLILVDVGMPGMNGLAAAELLHKKLPDARIIMLSMHADVENQRRAHALGARGYVLKDAAPSELLTALATVIAGHTWFCGAPVPPPLGPEDRGGPGEQLTAEGLSPREREVLRFIAEGKSSSEIGMLLRISHRTVDSHRLNLMRKLRVHTIAGLTRYAVRSGLCDLD